MSKLHFTSLVIYLTILDALINCSVISQNQISESSNSIDSAGPTNTSASLSNYPPDSHPPNRDLPEPPDHQAGSDSKAKQNKVIVILADGIRYDYLNDLTEFPGFQQLATNGVKSFVSPIFPSNSYPNWYSILTGLYADSHGFVNNFMYDEKHNETFLMLPPVSQHEYWWTNENDNKTQYKTEPIWITAEKNGIRTAVFWWDGCRVKIDNTLPTKCEPYQSYWTWPDMKRDFKNRFDLILNNFKTDTWQFALLYYEPIDSTGHVFGPNSVSRKDALKDLDDLLIYLQEELKKTNLQDQVNLVLVSDHGMLQVQSKKESAILIDIDDYLDERDVVVMLDRGSVSFIIPQKGREDKILADLRQANVKGMHVFRKDEMPDSYHYKNHYRIPPIILTADKGYFIRGFKNSDKTKPHWDVVYKGHHGYDAVTTDEMKTLMYATGPKLKGNHLNTQTMMMTDHYQLICRLLDLKPLPNEGQWSAVEGLLRDGRNSTSNGLANNSIIKSSKAKVSRTVRRESTNNRQRRNSSDSLSFNLLVILSLLVISQFRIFH